MTRILDSCHTLQRCIRYDIRISKQQKHSPKIWERKEEQKIFWIHRLTGWHWPDFYVIIQLAAGYSKCSCTYYTMVWNVLGMLFWQWQWPSIWYVKIWNINCKTRRIILKHWNSVLRLHHRQMWRIQMNLIWLILSHSLWN